MMDKKTGKTFESAINASVVTLKRQLLRHKRFSALNIFGMAAGMSVCMLVIMAVRDQYGYDDFHANGERIYRIISAEADKNQPLQKATHATAPLSLLEVIQDHSPYMEAGARLVSMEMISKSANGYSPTNSAVTRWTKAFLICSVSVGKQATTLMR